jgi:hypothetical protein
VGIAFICASVQPYFLRLVFSMARLLAMPLMLFHICTFERELTGLFQDEPSAPRYCALEAVLKDSNNSIDARTFFFMAVSRGLKRHPNAVLWSLRGDEGEKK